MSYEVNEWVFTVVDETKTSGGALPVVDDDSGVLYAVTVDKADSPSVYTDRNGTALTEVNGVARLALSNGHVRFYTDIDVTSLDIYFLSKRGCGILRAVAANTTHHLKVGKSGPSVTAIPLQGLGATAAAAETPLSVVPASSVQLIRSWIDIVSAGVNSSQFDLGIIASSTNGDANGILADATVSALGFGGDQFAGILSMFKFDGSNDILSVTPSQSHTAGALAYLELVF